MMKELCALGPNIYAYLMDNDSQKKKAKGTKMAVIRRIIINENYDCLFNNKTILKKQQRFKNDHDEVHTEEVNKTA